MESGILTPNCWFQRFFHFIISTDNSPHSKQTSKQLLYHSSNYYSLSRNSQNLSRKNTEKYNEFAYG